MDGCTHKRKDGRTTWTQYTPANIVCGGIIKAESQANWGISQLKHETSLFEAIMKPGDPDFTVSTMRFTTKTRHVSEMKQVVKSLNVKSGSRKQFLICFPMKYRDFSVKINSESTIFIFTVCKKRAFYEFSTKRLAQKV